MSPRARARVGQWLVPVESVVEYRTGRDGLEVVFVELVPRYPAARRPLELAVVDVLVDLVGSYMPATMPATPRPGETFTAVCRNPTTGLVATVPDAIVAGMTTTYEELADRHRSWVKRWDAAADRLRDLETRIDERRLDQRPDDRRLDELERARQDILGLVFPELNRQADELSELTQLELSMTRHPAGRGLK